MADDSTAPLYYPVLTGGVRSTAPPRSLGDPAGQYIWRDSLNMESRDGVVIGRPGFASNFPATPGQPPAPPTIATVDTTEYPRYINSSLSTSGVRLLVVVTDRQAYVCFGNTWYNVTPTYAVGTVTATNGAAGITGAGGMVWQTRGIDSAYIAIDGATYLLTVTGETTANLTPNFAGATGGGKAYTITRRFGGSTFISSGAHVDSEIFATLYNDSLYIAGSSLAVGNGSGPAVIKVADITSARTVSYITGGAAYDAGTDFISGLVRIVGLAILQDSRVVIAGDGSNETAAVYYSSQLNDAVWTVAPGGFTVLAEVDNQLRGVGAIGSSLTFHHSTGIVRGDPTGLSDPPLQFQRSDADVGTCSPLTLRRYLGGEAFLAADGDVKYFDGNSVQSLSGDGEVVKRLRDAGAINENEYHKFFAWTYPRRQEYVLFRVVNSGAGTIFLSFDGTSWRPSLTGTSAGHAVTAMSDAPEGLGFDLTVRAIAGHRTDSGATLRTYQEGVVDALGTPTFMLETDDLDMGMPMVLKTPARAAVWPVATMDDLTVGVRRADDTTYVTMMKDPLSTNRPMWFDFLPGQVSGSVAADNAHRWKLSGSTLRLGLFALLLRCVVGGEKEKVTSG